jgi:hypothetical protein
MAKTKTERIAVWLNPDQITWLKTKENVSATIRAMVTEAMNMDRMKEMVTKRAKGGAAKGEGRRAKEEGRKQKR